MLPVTRQQQQQQQSASNRPTNNNRGKKGKKQQGNNNKKKFNHSNNNKNRGQRPNCRSKQTLTRENWSPTPSDDSDQEVCLYQMAGKCGKADCPFSHDVKSPKILSVCKHYVVASSCSNFEMCRYLHEEFPCKFFFSSGQCQYGSDCKFNHERNELTTFLLEKYYEDEAARATGNVPQQQNVTTVFEMPKCSSLPQSSHNIEVIVDTPEYVSQLEIDPAQIAVQNQMEVEEEEQHHPVSHPVFSNFYQDTTEDPQQDDNNDTPMPLEITSILSSMEDEPPSSPQPNENQTETFLFSNKQLLKFDDSQTGLSQGNEMYPAKVITITLPSINENSGTNDIPTNNESVVTKSKSLNPSTKKINWRVCKVRSTKGIDYHYIKQSSSMREILMDPRLNKHRAY